jgi:protein-tyrosine phosphatase
MTLPAPRGRPFRVSMVCLGNICRSPMAAAVLQSRLTEHGLDEHVTVDSAGTGSWHIGERADPRTLAALSAHGYDADRHRARQFGADGFESCDLVVAMDHDNLRTLRRLAPDQAAAGRVVLLRTFERDDAGGDDPVVPDPYYGDQRDFESTLAIIERSVDGLLEVLSRHLATDT